MSKEQKGRANTGGGRKEKQEVTNNSSWINADEATVKMEWLNVRF